MQKMDLTLLSLLRAASEFGLWLFLSCGGRCRSCFGRLIQGLLNDRVVPIQVLAHLFNPSSVFVDFLPVDEGHAVGRVPNHQLLVPLHPEAHLAIESDPSPSPRLLRQNDRDFGCFGQDNGAEGE